MRRIPLRINGAAVALLVTSACATARADAVAPSIHRSGPSVTTTDAPLPDPATGSAVSLHGILAFADHHSPLLLVARAERQRGDAEVAAASPLLPENPELSLGAGPRMAPGGQGLDIEASLSQRFEIAGERGLRIETAERARDVSRLRLEEIRWLVHQRVHAAFHATLVARERAQAAAQVLEFTERLAQIARRRLAAGDISPLQVKVAEGELAQARQAKIAAQSGHLAARLDLAELAGWPVEQPPEVAGDLDEPRAAPEQGRLADRARQYNPRLRRQAGSVAEADARLRLAAREAWPEPALGVAYGQESEPGGAEPAHIGLVTLNIPIPLWQRNQGGRARANADAQVAKAVLEASSRALAAQVARARANVNAGAERIRSYGSEIIPAFERNLRMLERAFELGEVDVLQVMVARERFLEIERDALSAYDDYFAAVANLEALIGAEIWAEERHDDGRSTEEQP